MISRKMILAIGVGLLLALSSFTVSIGQSNIETVFDTNFTYNYEKSFSNSKEYTFTPPDVINYVDNNITSTDAGTITYANTDEIALTNSLYDISVTATSIYVVNDHDGTLQGAGEIFIEGSVNGNPIRFPSVGNELSLNDGESATISELLFSGTSAGILIIYEVRESDAELDDSLGFIYQNIKNPVAGSFEYYTDIGDAAITFQIDVTPLTTAITAQDLLDGYKPYLFVDDETGSTEMPDGVHGRVIGGNDAGIDALVLQYFYYWNEEYSPDGGTFTFKLHDNDFEGLMIFLDKTDISTPYRIVFNGYQYTELPGFPSENLVIFEAGATEEKLQFSNIIGDDLSLLLGATANQSANYYPLSAMENWGYDLLFSKDVRIGSSLGLATFELTVDTSYHTFDLGPGGTEYGYNYIIEELSSTVIREWYKIMDETFLNGTHEWSYFGIDVPVTGPFTFDVTQVFDAPYIISGYSNVVADVGRLTIAQNSGLKIDHSFNLWGELSFPGKMKISHPKGIIPGGTASVELTLENSDQMLLTIGYNYSSLIDFSYWFLQTNSSYDVDGEMIIDVDTAGITPQISKLGLAEYSVEDISIVGDYLTLDSLVISPKFIGNILSGEISINLWAILETAIETALPQSRPVFTILNFLIDSMLVTAAFSLDTYVEGTIDSETTGVSTSITDLTFTEESMTIPVDIDFTGIPSSTSVDIIISKLDYKMDFTTDWYFGIYFAKPFSYLIGGLIWQIGTFPALTAELLQSNGGSFTINVFEELADTSDDTEALPVDLLFLITLIPITIIHKKRRVI
ncbi:MAG: hypothetical protein GPJ54_11415 [Candidatus Heimdallarchaeota archaeon]|nr:hypothetical protein [Candidatus Heimdallarchaeota archaeon]